MLTKSDKAKLAVVCRNTAQKLWALVEKSPNNIPFAPYAEAFEQDARRLAWEAAH